jgi:hypothetical protein
VGQQPDAGAVADGPQAFPGAQVRVDRDAVRAGRDADRVQVGGHPRAPAVMAVTSRLRLGRDAGPVRALAADQFPLHHRHVQVAVGQFAGAVLTR